MGLLSTRIAPGHRVRHGDLNDAKPRAQTADVPLLHGADEAGPPDRLAATEHLAGSTATARLSGQSTSEIPPGHRGPLDAMRASPGSAVGATVCHNARTSRKKPREGCAPPRGKSSRNSGRHRASERARARQSPHTSASTFSD
jgi:hypothetical protein